MIITEGTKWETREEVQCKKVIMAEVEGLAPMMPLEAPHNHQCILKIKGKQAIRSQLTPSEVVVVDSVV